MESAQSFQHYLCSHSENNKNREKQDTVNQEGHNKHFWD